MPPSKRDIREQQDEDAIHREHHFEPEVSPQLAASPGRRSRAPKTPLVAEQSTVCPRCGGELRFTTAPNFYGQTIEQCVNVVRCGHWRTLERIRRPELAPAPRGAERPVAAISPRTGRRRGPAGPRAATVAALNELLADLPASSSAARTLDEVAFSRGLRKHVALHLLDRLEAEGRVAKQPRRGQAGRPPWEYWRVA